ncbi:hypothetical protein [Burkholderia thailandensis]|uniref:hypothetical protein n=1 Tax=Burkholderia thailandensis TaxID=57975 RepID=UPI002D77D18C|nr:hypothetical protein [Burkholderia thailandensis]WRS69117.1 hypothetical protein U9S59_20400 [Burkholderia thailandensis]
MEKLNELLREYAQSIRRDDGTGFMHADAIRELFRARAASANETADERAAFEYDDVVSICDAHGIGLPIDCVEMVVDIVKLSGLLAARVASANDTGAEEAAEPYDEGDIERHFDDHGFYLHGFEEEDRANFFEAALALVAGRSPAMAAEAAPPSGYAYRYPSLGGTVIRFNSGKEVNGSRPIEAIPYWFAAPQPAQADARVGLTGEQWEELRLIARTYNERGFPKHAREFFARVHPARPEPRAEVTHGDTTMDECMASLLDRLEVAELYADRYRYLRERPLDAVSVGGVFAGKTPDNVVLNGADLDAAIDAARTGASS